MVSMIETHLSCWRCNHQVTTYAWRYRGLESMRLCAYRPAQWTSRLRRCYTRNHRHVAVPSSTRIDIPRSGDTTVSVVVHTPLISAASTSPAAVLYFPRGPILQNAAIDEEVIKVLRSTLPYHIVQVDYRLDKDYQHPSATYDTLAAFDWTVENVLPARTGRWSGKADHKGQIAACGELIGGTLATMLSLTECRTGVVGVVAAAVNNPVLNWADLDVPQQGRGRRTKKVATDVTSPSLELIRRARDRLFRKPRDYYDTFASPMLLFRSAGSSPPAANASLDDGLQFHDHGGFLMPLGHPSELDTGSAIEARPRSSRQFPSRAHGLALPAFHITSGSSSILAAQAEELTHQLRQSILRGRKARASRRSRRSEDSFCDHDPMYTSDDELAQAEATLLDSRVQLTEYAGSGLWSDGPAGHAMIHSMASWLRERLVH